MRLSIVVMIDRFMSFALSRWPWFTSPAINSLRRVFRPIRRLILDKPPSPVWSLQVDAEFYQLLELFDSLKPTNIIEIGSYAGGTLWHFMRMAPKGSRFVSVDMLVDEGDVHYPQLQKDQRDGHEFLWKKWAQIRGHDLIILESDSTSSRTIRAVHGLMPQIDFCFIDGGHDEKTVRSDFENYGKMSKVVAFHDISGPDNPDVVKIWGELKKTYRTKEFVLSKTSPGIGVLWT